MGDPWTTHANDLAVLRRWIRLPTAPQRLVTRSRIVLLLAGGVPARQVSRVLGVSRPTVALWRSRFHEGGCDALTKDRPGRGRKKTSSNSTPSET